MLCTCRRSSFCGRGGRWLSSQLTIRRCLLGRGRSAFQSISPKQYPLSIETLADAVLARSWANCGLQKPHSRHLVDSPPQWLRAGGHSMQSLLANCEPRKPEPPVTEPLEWLRRRVRHALLGGIQCFADVFADLLG